MKILHAPWEIAGQMGIISKAQRELGHESICVVWAGNWLKYKCDENLQLDRCNIFIANIKKLIFFLQNVNRYDVYHFHYGGSLLPFNMDLKY